MTAEPMIYTIPDDGPHRLEPTSDSFTLTLADGQTVTIPCTPIRFEMSGTAALAAAIHHLMGRVAQLEAQFSAPDVASDFDAICEQLAQKG